MVHAGRSHLKSLMDGTSLKCCFPPEPIHQLNKRDALRNKIDALRERPVRSSSLPDRQCSEMAKQASHTHPVTSTAKVIIVVGPAT